MAPRAIRRKAWFLLPESNQCVTPRPKVFQCALHSITNFTSKRIVGMSDLKGASLPRSQLLHAPSRAS